MGRTGNSELRNKILEEAIGIVYREGPSRVTMRSLAEKLGYSAATIYLHFENKEELLKEIALHGFDKLADAMGPLDQVANPIEAVSEACRRYANFGLEHPELYRLMFQESVLSTNVNSFTVEELARAQRPWQISREIIRCGIESGAFRKMDPDVETARGWAMMHGYVQLASSEQLPIPNATPELLAEIFEALLAGRLQVLQPE